MENNYKLLRNLQKAIHLELDELTSFKLKYDFFSVDQMAKDNKDAIKLLHKLKKILIREINPDNFHEILIGKGFLMLAEEARKEIFKTDNMITLIKNHNRKFNNLRRGNLFGGCLVLYGLASGEDMNELDFKKLVDNAKLEKGKKLSNLLSNDYIATSSLDKFNNIIFNSSRSNTARKDFIASFFPAYKARTGVAGYTYELKRTLLDGKMFRFASENDMRFVSGLVVYPNWFPVLSKIIKLRFNSQNTSGKEAIVLQLSKNKDSLFYYEVENNRRVKKIVVESFEDLFTKYFT